MGKRGPAKEPTALKLLKGNPSKETLRPESEPQPEAPDDNVVAPIPLSERANKIFVDMVKTLNRLKVLGVTDMLALARYCDTFDRWLTCKQFLDERGETYPMYGTYEETDKKGEKVKKRFIKYVAQFPQVAMYRNLNSQLLRFEQEFGLTPSARSRILVINGGNVDDETAKFLFGTD